MVQRRLEAFSGTSPGEDDYLQVFYPYLSDTYEYVQVGLVFKRLNRFLEMLHDLRLPRRSHAGEIEVAHQIHEKAEDIFKAFREPLKSGFEIAPELMPAGPAEPMLEASNAQMIEHFRVITRRLSEQFSITWNGSDSSPHQCRGTVVVHKGRLVARTDVESVRCASQQPFSLDLRTTHGGKLLLRIKSRLGAIRGEGLITRVFELQRKKPWLKVCAVLEEGTEYRLSVQSDLLFAPATTQPEEVERVFARLLAGAGEIEDDMFGQEAPAEDGVEKDNAEDSGDGSD